MENTITKEQMDSMKALADVNIKISEAQNLLFKLQETETEYLVEREGKAVERIQKVLEDSKEILSEIDKNYEKVQQFASTITSFSETLNKSFDSFVKLLSDFRERSDLWDKEVKATEEKIDLEKRDIHTQRIQIENDTKANQQKEKMLKDEWVKIESDRGLISRTVERLKQGKI